MKVKTFKQTGKNSELLLMFMKKLSRSRDINSYLSSLTCWVPCKTAFLFGLWPIDLPLLKNCQVVPLPSECVKDDNKQAQRITGLLAQFVPAHIQYSRIPVCTLNRCMVWALKKHIVWTHRITQSFSSHPDWFCLFWVLSESFKSLNLKKKKSEENS